MKSKNKLKIAASSTALHYLKTKRATVVLKHTTNLNNIAGVALTLQDIANGMADQIWSSTLKIPVFGLIIDKKKSLLPL
ncbi:MAG: hypothetical protein ACOH2R_25375 [Pseudomonas sp.]